MSKNTKKVALGAALAGAAGYVAGILTAPKSGKETRKDIKDTADKTVKEAEAELQKLHTELTKLLDQAKSKGDQVGDKAKAEWETVVDKTKASKEKARQMLSALHEGDAEDKDLAKAIKDANAAIDHLKTYLKK